MKTDKHIHFEMAHNIRTTHAMERMAFKQEKGATVAVAVRVFERVFLPITFNALYIKLFF